VCSIFGEGHELAAEALALLCGLDGDVLDEQRALFCADDDEAVQVPGLWSAEDVDVTGGDQLGVVRVHWRGPASDSFDVFFEASRTHALTATPSEAVAS
jgi:hypothetical protein